MSKQNDSPKIMLIFEVQTNILRLQKSIVFDGFGEIFGFIVTWSFGAHSNELVGCFFIARCGLFTSLVTSSGNRWRTTNIFVNKFDDRASPCVDSCKKNVLLRLSHFNTQPNHRVTACILNFNWNLKKTIENYSILTSAERAWIVVAVWMMETRIWRKKIYKFPIWWFYERMIKKICILSVFCPRNDPYTVQFFTIKNFINIIMMGWLFFVFIDSKWITAAFCCWLTTMMNPLKCYESCMPIIIK